MRYLVKTSSFFIAALIGLMTMSCSSKGTKTGTKESDSEEASAQVEGLDSASSPDKTTFELAGPVTTCQTEEQSFVFLSPTDKECQEQWELIEKVEFDSEGNLLSYTDSHQSKAKDIERDAEGRIATIVCPMIDDMGEEAEYKIEYKYDGSDENGKVASRHYYYIWADWPEEYTRDAQGRIDKVAADPNGIDKRNLKYHYLEDDSYGNWTKAEIHDETNDNKQVVRRTITYSVNHKQE